MTKDIVKCNKCNEDRPLDRFVIRERGELRKECKDCTNKRIKELRVSYRKQVFDYYGWLCKCCGEDEPAFMTIDHIYNDGYLDRMEYGRKRKLVGKDLYYKIIFIEKFPEDKYQTLCHNCNFGKWDGRLCPHKQKVLQTGEIQEETMTVHSSQG